ncbi:MAG: succinate dehydrogenase cytochrome b subunit [Culturomica sp.]|jgi:succinate dehydrogenase / fumarate reductase cytochrome b subunit|nr:succinate dehydrogenase cytochrome b subunit [Culturomica sp.]
MSNFLTSSIGKKVIMSISGLFLIAFLIVHLSLNLLLIFDNSGELFNIGAHFMATNPIIKVVEPVLALGFVVHIILATILTIQNMKARPVGYARSEQSNNASWASRNMFILGGLILIFLVIHLYNFWLNIKLPELGTPLEITTVDGVEMENAYLMVSSLFKNSVFFCMLYVLAAIFLGLHLSHGFWSCFQSVGFSNKIWRKRLEWVGYLFAIVIGVGFAIIPLYFLAGFAG